MTHPASADTATAFRDAEGVVTGVGMVTHGDSLSRRRTLPPDVGRMLWAARHRRGLSLRRAPQRVGCSHALIVAFEAGTRAPSTAMAAELIRAYRLDREDADWLYDWAVPDAGRSSPYRDSGEGSRTTA